MNAQPDDPIFQRTSEFPIKEGIGSSSKQHRLKETDSSIRFVPSTVYIVFTVILSGIGMAIIGSCIYVVIDYLLNPSSDTLLIGLIFGTIFSMLIGGLPFYLGFAFSEYGFNSQIYFDKEEKVFVKDKRIPFLKHLNVRPFKEGRLAWDDIYALQILNAKFKLNNITMYEMNVVSKDAKRFCITHHGDLEAILDQAGVISQLLDIPIWFNEEDLGGLSILKTK